jgi:hypothetical protein
MRTRWKLGQLLAEQGRAKHPGKGKVIRSVIGSLLKKLGLTSTAAMKARCGPGRGKKAENNAAGWQSFLSGFVVAESKYVISK